jgi:FkbM family methyltransferase
MMMKALGFSYLFTRRPAGEGVVRAATRYGELFYRPTQSDLLTLWQTLGAREYDLERFPQWDAISRTYHQALEAGRTPVIIDAGANIGGASIWFSSKFPQARVLAVEPEPANAELCRLNTDGRNVQVFEAAVGAKPGTVALTNTGQAWGVQTARGGNIPILTVADLLSTVSCPQLLIAKIDIEGFEADLFSEETAWIQQATALIIEPHDWMLPGRCSSAAFRSAIGPEFEMLISGENLVFVRRAG